VVAGALVAEAVLATLLAVSQHGLHTLFMQTQSLSQSSLDEHAAPKQCPSHVQVWNDVLGSKALSLAVGGRVMLPRTVVKDM
jgi:hypothetical protein